MKSLKINAVLNMIRRGAAIIFPLITFTYASHILGAEKVGIFSFSQSIVNYFLLIALLGISTYAVREGQAVRDAKEKLSQFTSEVYSISIMMTILSYLLLIFLLVIWRKTDSYRIEIGILSISIILTTVGADWINTLFEDYLFITVRYIAVQIICMVCLFVFVRTKDDLINYTIIGMLASAGGNFLNIVHVRRLVKFHFVFPMNFKKHIKPMLILFSNDLAIRIYLISDITILGLLTNDHIVGVYTLSSRVYTALKEVINALILVTIPRFSYYISHGLTGEYRQSCNRTISGIITLIVPIITGLVFEAKSIILIMGGSDYVEGVTSLRILAFAMIFAVGGCFFSYAVLIPNKQEKFFLMSTVAAAAVNIVFNIILIPFLSLNAAALTTLLAEGIVFMISLLIGLRHVDITVRMRDLVSALAGAVIISGICFFCETLQLHFIYRFMLAVMLSASAYIIILFLGRNSFAVEIGSILFAKLGRKKEL